MRIYLLRIDILEVVELIPVRFVSREAALEYADDYEIYECVERENTVELKLILTTREGPGIFETQKDIVGVPIEKRLDIIDLED